MVRDPCLGRLEGPEARLEVLTVAYRRGCNQAPYLHHETFQEEAFPEEAFPFHQLEVHQGEPQEEVALESRHLVRLAEGFAVVNQLR